MHSMSLNIGFVDHIQAVEITEPVKGGIIRVMRGPNCIEVVLPGAVRMDAWCETYNIDRVTRPGA